jgi:hypothetical protein
VSPSAEHNVTVPVFPQLQRAPGALPLRVAAMFKVLVSLLLLVLVMLEMDDM